MKHLFSILALMVITMVAGPGVLGQCTISNVTMFNLSQTGSTASFSLRFEHLRNSGNKWITIHLWQAIDYPAYEYTSGTVPTTARLGAQVPFGTIVINNSVVSSSGTYTAAQAFVSSYQSDGSFQMATGSGSTLVYNATTNVYTLNLLNVTLPGSITTIKADCWSSQAASNQVAHCFQVCIPIVITPLAATVESFRGKADDGAVTFNWVTQTESKVSHFVVDKQDGDQWTQVGMVGSRYEDGNSSMTTSYSLKVNTRPITYAMFSIWFLVFIILVMSSRIRVGSLVVFGVVYGGLVFASCKKTALDERVTQKQMVWYRLSEVDLNGKKTVCAFTQVNQ